MCITLCCMDVCAIMALSSNAPIIHLVSKVYCVVTQKGPTMRNAYKKAQWRKRRISANGRMDRLCECGETAMVVKEPPVYFVRCGGCGLETDPLYTEIGAIRSWEEKPRAGGGWNKLYQFECCGEESEIRCNGPDPRRNLSNQMVIVQCRICQRHEMQTHLAKISSFSILSARQSSS